MERDTRIVRIESDVSLGQFVEEAVQSQFEEMDGDVRVTELDPNTVPEEILE
jgi:hypothetical protein